MHGRVREVTLDAGVLAVTQDAAGRLIPVCAWVLRDAGLSIHEVIERIRSEHRAIPTAERGQSEVVRISGPADVVGLYHELDGATLFPAGPPWRIRGLAEQESAGLLLPTGRRTWVRRLIDLPDGTYLAVSDFTPPVYVRGRVDALAPIDPPAPVGPGLDADLIVVFPSERRSSE